MVSSWIEILGLLATIGCLSFLALSLATKTMWAVVFGVAINFFLFVITLATLSIDSNELSGLSKMLLIAVSVFALWTPGLLGLFVQKNRQQILDFSYSNSKTFMGSATRWVVRSRNIIISFTATYAWAQLGMRDDVSPIWVLSFGILLFWPTIASPEGLGIKAHHRIRAHAPKSWARIRRANVALVLSASILLWGTASSSVIVDSRGAYIQLFALVTIVGLIALWFSRQYKIAALEIPQSPHASLLLQSHKYAQEIAWGLIAIGVCFVPTALAWDWLSTALSVIAISLGLSAARIGLSTHPNDPNNKSIENVE